MRAFVIIALVVALLAEAAATARAGTTGNINGVVVTTHGLPIAGARVVAASPSQTATTTADAAGRFSLISLVPDTYTVSVSKEGFEPSTLAGVSVFADQAQSLRVVLGPILRTIARVTTRSSMDLVKSGTTSDVYSVNATVTQAAAGIGGGGSLNSAYSAIATVPGLFVPPEQQGWNQVVYIRGGSYDQIGYEYDGVPVNRSFDNYPGGTAGTLGQQEVEVYTGGGNAGANATGLAGFINQVIKTGTHPGYANVNAGFGTPTYYHNLQVEVGGATPDRLFSYYVGMGGYNQDYRYLNQFNGASLANVWGSTIITDNTSLLFYNFPGVYPTCVDTTSALSPVPNAPVYDPFNSSQVPNPIPLPINREYKGGRAYDPGCYGTISPAFASYSNIMDRENVVNLHFGIPHHQDAGRDDVQMLYNTTTMLSQFYSSSNDIGPNIIPALDFVGYGTPIKEYWGDFVTWPSGTKFGAPAAGLQAVPYYEPASPKNRCANVDPFEFYGPPYPQGTCAANTISGIPSDTRDGFWNDATIVKLQYQHNMGSNAYLRVYGYTFYSDWLQNGPLSWGTPLYGFGVLSYDYELNAHTSGIAAEFADQLNSRNLLTVDLNYTTASTDRYNNTNFNNTLGTSATNLVKGSNCIAYTSGNLYNETLPPGYANPYFPAGSVAPCNSALTSGTFQTPVCPPPASSNCTPAGAAWKVTYTGNSGLENTVVPKFTTLGLEEKLQPNDKLDINVGLRLARYQFDLANTSNDGQDFWYAAGQREFCYNPVTQQPVVIPAQPASGRPAQPYISFVCPVDRSSGTPVQTVHPDGKSGHLLLSNTYSPTEVDTAVEPRLGMTYTINPDTVLRFSAGRYIQEPQNYEVQYNAKDNNLAFNLFQAWWAYGFTTPRHDPQVQYSNNFDASYERRFKGTDMSLKVSPYYRYATNQLYGVGLPYGISGSLNSGIEQVEGVELQLTKGDFNKDGLSYILSYTYQNSSEKWANYPGTTINPIDPYNVDIQAYDALTKAGGGARCYTINPSVQAGYSPDPSCQPMVKGYRVISNPYYNMPRQGLLDRNGWYPVGLDFPYLVPHALAAIVNYRHHRFAISPAMTLNSGAQYGNPADTVGLDPRTCALNSAGLRGSPISKKNPLQADYTSCSFAATPSGTLYIPNPETGGFDTFGAFRQPSQFNLSLNLSYDVSPSIKANLLLTNLVNMCFGGSKTAWSSAFPPNAYTCGYVPNLFYISNFYNGTSPSDRGANGVPLNHAFAHSYIPAWADTNAFTLPVPFNAYLQINFKV